MGKASPRQVKVLVSGSRLETALSVATLVYSPETACEGTGGQRTALGPSGTKCPIGNSTIHVSRHSGRAAAMRGRSSRSGEHRQAEATETALGLPLPASAPRDPQPVRLCQVTP